MDAESHGRHCVYTLWTSPLQAKHCVHTMHPHTVDKPAPGEALCPHNASTHCGQARSRPCTVHTMCPHTLDKHAAGHALCPHNVSTHSGQARCRPTMPHQ
eukprot:360180-Chlamydomonas_euryale.AAC.2